MMPIVIKKTQGLNYNLVCFIIFFLADWWQLGCRNLPLANQTLILIALSFEYFSAHYLANGSQKIIQYVLVIL